MNRRSIFKSGRGPRLILLLALVLGLMLSAGPVPVAQAAEITVCADGCAYTSIEAAINAAAADDTVIVYPGVYPGNININKSVTIESLSGGGDFSRALPVQTTQAPGDRYPDRYAPAVFELYDSIARWFYVMAFVLLILLQTDPQTLVAHFITLKGASTTPT